MKVAGKTPEENAIEMRELLAGGSRKLALHCSVLSAARIQKSHRLPISSHGWDGFGATFQPCRGRLAVREMVLMNASAALYIAGKAGMQFNLRASKSHAILIW